MIGTCASCRHSVSETAPDRSLVRFCRRFPPQLTAVAIPVQTIKGSQFVAQQNSAFPVVNSDWCCGEFAHVSDKMP